MSLREQKFPAIPNLPLNFGIPEDVFEKIAAFPNCSSRALCAVAFAEAAQGGDSFYEELSDSKYEAPLRDAYMRAALGEFVSIEDMVSKDLDAAKISANPKCIYESKRLLPILFKEIRNLNFHISSASSEEKVVEVNVRFKQSEPELLPLKLPIRILAFDEEDFLKLHNLKPTRKGRCGDFWRERDVRSILEWFNTNQHRAGAHRLLTRAVVEYLEFLISEYNLAVV